MLTKLTNSNISPKHTKSKREARQDKIITEVTTGLEIDHLVEIGEWHLGIEIEVELGMSNFTDKKYRGGLPDSYRDDHRRGHSVETQNYRDQKYRSGHKDSCKAS